MLQQGDMSRNRSMFWIFHDSVPVNESVLILPIVSVKADSDAVTVGLVWNFECCRRAKLELQFDTFSINSWRLVRQQIRNTRQQTGEAANNQKRPTLCNEKSSGSLPPDPNGRNDSNHQAHQNSKRCAHKHDEHGSAAFHVRHLRQSA